MVDETEYVDPSTVKLPKFAVKDEGIETKPRPLPKLLKTFTWGLAILFTLYELYFCVFGIMEAYFVRSSMVIIGILLVFLTKAPSKKLNDTKTGLVSDLILVLLTIGIGYYIFSEYPDLLQRLGTPTSMDLWVGGILMLLVLEACRRVMGPAMAIIVGVLVVYTLWGPQFPGPLKHPGMSIPEIIDFNFLSSQGLFGVTVDVIATAVFPFVIFSCFLMETGASDVFVDISRALMGHRTGGPAKVSVVSSALVGTISGSAVANVIVDGIFNIPLMKKQGYPPVFAAGVEAATSTGGQIMPPVMAAAAFIMAGFLGVPYSTVAISAALPACLYYLSVWASIHFVAKREGLRGLPKNELPRFIDVMRRKWVLFLPLAIVVVMLIRGYSTITTGGYGIVAALIVTCFYKETRFTFKNILHALEASASGILQITAICAAAGIIVALVFLSGIGLKIPYLVRFISQGNIFITLFVTMIAALILGCGLPTTAGYIVLATLGASALTDVGITKLAAHLFIFYFIVINNLTPPVALAAYAAASIAKSDPWKTAIAGFKLAIAGFLIPYFFVFNRNFLMQGPWYQILFSLFTGGLGVIMLAAAVSGYYYTSLNLFRRGVLAIGALMLIGQSWEFDLIGLAILAANLLYEKMKKGRLESVPAPRF